MKLGQFLNSTDKGTHVDFVPEKFQIEWALKAHNADFVPSLQKVVLAPNPQFVNYLPLISDSLQST